MEIGFSCVQTDEEGFWAVTFREGAVFDTPSAENDLRLLVSRRERVLVLGVFDWSNYSRQVIRDPTVHHEEFASRGIGLAAFCPGCHEQVARLSPAFLPNLYLANTEPLMYLIHFGMLAKARFGRLGAFEVINWIERG